MTELGTSPVGFLPRGGGGGYGAPRAVWIPPGAGPAGATGTSACREALEGRGVPEGSFAIFSNEVSGDLLVEDIESDRVVSRIRVGSRPTAGP